MWTIFLIVLVVIFILPLFIEWPWLFPPRHLAPSLFAKAFAGRGAPVNAGWHFLPVNHLTALVAFYA
jgi:hypothetical protein